MRWCQLLYLTIFIKAKKLAIAEIGNDELCIGEQAHQGCASLFKLLYNLSLSLLKA